MTCVVCRAGDKAAADCLSPQVGSGAPRLPP